MNRPRDSCRAFAETPAGNLELLRPVIGDCACQGIDVSGGALNEEAERHPAEGLFDNPRHDAGKVRRVLKVHAQHDGMTRIIDQNGHWPAAGRVDAQHANCGIDGECRDVGQVAP